MMDEGIGEFAEFEDLLKEFLPDTSTDIGGGKGVYVPSSGMTNSNQQKAIAAMTSHINPTPWRYSQQRTSDSPNRSIRQTTGSSLSAPFEGFSQNQTSANMVPELQRHQLLQKQALEQGAHGPNLYQFSMQPNTYPSNLRPHEQVQTSLGSRSTSSMMKHHQTLTVLQHTDQTTSRNGLERQSGLVRERGHPDLHMSGFHQPQNITLFDQLKPGNQLQTTHLRPLQVVSESTPQVGLTNNIDSVKQAYRKLLELKEMYLPDVIKSIKDAEAAKNRATNAEEMRRCQLSRDRAQKLYAFLNLSASDVSHWQKEKLYQAMKDVVRCMGMPKARSALPVKQTQQAQQRVNYLHYNSAPASLEQTLRQGGPSRLSESSPNSYNVVSSPMMSSLQYNPVMSKQVWASQGNVVPSPKSQVDFGERSLRKLLHPSNGVARCNNNNNLGASEQTVMMNICNSLNNSVSPTALKHKMKQPVQQSRCSVGLNQKSSPQNSQKSSSRLELKDSSSKLSKSETPSISASVSALPSPLTPVTPSSVPADSAKSPFSSSLEESSKAATSFSAPTELPLQEGNQLVTDTQGLLKACVNTESNCPSKKQSSCSAKGDPAKRLVDVVKSMSSEVLTATLLDMESVLLHDESAEAIFRDLADDDIINSENQNLSLEPRMKRQLESTTSNQMANQTGFCLSGCRIKRQRKEDTDMLLEEIKEINEKLIEVVLDVKNNVEDDSSSRGTLVRCSYIPIGFSGNMKIPNASKMMIPHLFLELIVTADYPNSSPTVLETMPPNCSEHMWMKAKSSFSSSLRSYTQPISLKEMAESWDCCARKAFHEFAEQMGGGNVISKYGNWENCAVAV